MDYYNEPREMPNRMVTFQVDERPTILTSRGKASVSKMDTYKLIPVVTSVSGIVLIVIGICYYVFHLVQFISALVRYSDRYDTDGMRSFWDFMFFMVTISLTSEVIVVILSSVFCLMLYNSIFSCSKIKQLATTTKRILKSMTILFLGVVICYLQTVVGLLRFSTLIKVNHWLSEVNCGCGHEETP